jgi:LPS export ABC transporter protein LptC
MKRALGSFGLLVGAIGLAACRDSKAPPVATGPAVADSADQILFKMRYLLSTNGIQRGDLHADTAYVLSDQTRFDLRKAHVNFTTETGVPEGTMEANRGVYTTTTQVLEGWGDVVVKLVDGRTLKSPHITFNQITHQIASDTSYQLIRGNDTQQGVGFTSNQTFSRFQCLRDCSGKTSVLIPEK